MKRRSPASSGSRPRRMAIGRQWRAGTVLLPTPVGPTSSSARPASQRDRRGEGRPCRRQIEVEAIDLDTLAPWAMANSLGCPNARRLRQAVIEGREALQPRTARVAMSVYEVTMKDSAPCTCTEGIGGLRQPAQLDLLRKIARRRDDIGKDHRELVVAKAGPPIDRLVRRMIDQKLSTHGRSGRGRSPSRASRRHRSATISAFSRNRTRLKRKSAS